MIDQRNYKILEYCSKVLKRKRDKEANQIVAGNELMAVLGLDDFSGMLSRTQYMYNSTGFIAKIGNKKLIIVRLYFHTSDSIEQLCTDISMVVNELLPFRTSENKDIILDIVFTWEGLLLGMLPILLDCDSEEKSLNQLKSAEYKNKKNRTIMYYDCCELWMDLQKIKDGEQKAQFYIIKYIKKMERLRKLLFGYMDSIYGNHAEVLSAYGKTAYIYEHKRSDGWAFKHFTLYSLLDCIKEGKLSREDVAGGKLFVAIPGTYVPGKYIDIGYFDAMDGKGIDLQKEDIAFVLGFGSGVDLVHSLRHVERALAVEVNPFGIASAYVNLKLDQSFYKAVVMWQDLRELAKGTISIPEEFQGHITKLLWNAPYESVESIANPTELKGFFDNYSFLSWFVPYLSKGNIFASVWRALIWRIVDGSGTEEDYFKQYGFEILPNDEENVFIVMPV